MATSAAKVDAAELLAAERARGDRLEAELRRPLVLRLLEAWRRQ